MKRYPTNTPLSVLAYEAEQITLTRMADKGFMKDYWRGFIVTRKGLSVGNTGTIDIDILDQYPGIYRSIIDLSFDLNLGAVFQCWLGVLKAHTGDLDVHTDGELPGNPVRYHLPIITNPQALYWSQPTGDIHLTAGYWHGPILYRQPHKAYNGGDDIRAHIVADFLR